MTGLVWIHRVHSPDYSLWTATDARGETVAQVVRQGREWKVNLYNSRAGLQPCLTLTEGKRRANVLAADREGRL